jgi:hypothetical protein
MYRIGGQPRIPPDKHAPNIEDNRQPASNSIDRVEVEINPEHATHIISLEK